MAWRVPKLRPRHFEAMDPEATTETLHDFSQEEGELNEQNWAAKEPWSGAIGNRIIDRQALILESGSTYCTHQAHFPFTRYERTATHPINKKDITNNSSWSTIEQRRLDVENSLLWVLASFQQVYAYEGNVFITANMHTQVQYALRVNGAIIHESITGSLDVRNDHFGNCGPGGAVPITIDAILPVTSGRTLVELVARNPVPELIVAELAVGTRELICLEFRR